MDEAAFPTPWAESSCNTSSLPGSRDDAAYLPASQRATWCPSRTRLARQERQQRLQGRRVRVRVAGLGAAPSCSQPALPGARPRQSQAAPRACWAHRAVVAQWRDGAQVCALFVRTLLASSSLVSRRRPILPCCCTVCQGGSSRDCVGNRILVAVACKPCEI